MASESMRSAPAPFSHRFTNAASRPPAKPWTITVPRPVHAPCSNVRVRPRKWPRVYCSWLPRKPRTSRAPVYSSMVASRLSDPTRKTGLLQSRCGCTGSCEHILSSCTGLMHSTTCRFSSEFHEVDGMTEMVVTHERWPALTGQEGPTIGWHCCLARLAQLVEATV